MTKNRLFVCSLLAVSVFNIAVPDIALADVCDDLHNKLAAGKAVKAPEADALNAELLKDGKDPFKHLVAGEVLIGLGLYDQAEAEYEQADSLQKDFVRKQFGKELSAKHHTLRLLAPYMQKRFPTDSAYLFYVASRDFAGMQMKQNMDQVSLQPIIDEFSAAANAKDAWPNSFALLSMLEYKESCRPSPGQNNSQATLLGLAIKHANQELKRDPANPLAHEVWAMAMLKYGKNSGQAEKTLMQVLKVAPWDAEINQTLGKMYLEKHEYKSAIRPLLIGLLTEAVQPGERLAVELAHHVSAQEIIACVNELAAALGQENPKTLLMSLRTADALTAAGKPEDAITVLNTAFLGAPVELRPVFQLRMGQVLVRMQRFEEAFYFLDEARKNYLDPALRFRIFLLRNRVARQQVNMHRDIATKIKILISH